jgi:D-lyxose ketol-isomerase
VNDCLSLVKQSGADGISNDVAAQILSRNNRTIQTVHGRMLKNGDIFIGRVGNHHKYFATQEYADAYSSKQKKRQGQITRKRVEAKKPKETKPKTAQEMMPKRLGTTAVVAEKKVSWVSEVATISADVKITVEKTPRGRFEPTGEESYFSSLQIGNYKPSDSAISRAYG